MNWMNVCENQQLPIKHKTFLQKNMYLLLIFPSIFSYPLSHSPLINCTNSHKIFKYVWLKKKYELQIRKNQFLVIYNFFIATSSNPRNIHFIWTGFIQRHTTDSIKSVDYSRYSLFFSSFLGPLGHLRSYGERDYETSNSDNDSMSHFFLFEKKNLFFKKVR